MASRYADADEYYAAQTPEAAAMMKKVYAAVEQMFPQLEEKIAWNILMLHVGGKYVMGVSSTKGYLLYNPFSKQIMIDFDERLAAYTPKSFTFRIPFDWEIDRDLLRDLTQARLDEIAQGT